MTTGPSLDYDSVCRMVGRLFLESQHEIARLAKEAQGVQHVRDELQKCQRKLVELEARDGNAGT